MKKLLEASRNELMAQSKRAEREKDGKTRYEKRLKSRVSSSNKTYNQLDMNSLLKDGIMNVSVQVKGETDDYVVKMSWGGFIDELHRELKNNNDNLDLRIVVRSLVTSFNKNDVYVHCNCLHPDTRIKLLDGTCPTISEIKERFDNGEKLYVYSVDENGDFKPGEVEDVLISGNASELIKVTLDNGKEIITTPGHLYLNRYGKYVEASKLKVGDSLMPLYFGKTPRDYDTIKLNTTGKYHSIYKLVADYFKSDDIQRALTRAQPTDNMPYNVAIHHVDFNKHNNNPENLEAMTAREHWEYHARLCDKDRPVTDRMREIARQNAYKRNANPTERMINARIEFQKKGTLRNYDEDRKLQQAEIGRKALTTYWETLSEEDRIVRRNKQSDISKKAWENGSFDTDNFKLAAQQRGQFLCTPEIEALAKAGVQKYWKSLSEEEHTNRAQICLRNIKKAQDSVRGSHFTDEHKNNISKSLLNASLEKKADHTKKILLTKIQKCLLYLIEHEIELTESNYLKYRCSGTPSFKKYFESIEDAVSYFQINHKVACVEFINCATPVYDIKVKKFNNFLVDAGVILHNCSDFLFRFSYWSTVEKTNSGEPQLIPSKITNPNNTLGSACKHVMLVLANTSWIVKVSSVIVNYINYYKNHRQQDYAKLIYPYVYGKKYEEPIQLSMEPEVDELSSTEQDIDIANKSAIDRTRFQKGNTQGVRFAPKDTLDDQEDIDDII